MVTTTLEAPHPRRALRLIAALALAGAAAGVLALTDTPSVTRPVARSGEGLIDPTAPPFGDRMFSDDSPFNTRLPTDPIVHPASAAIIATMTGDGSRTAIVAVDRWTIPVFVADERTPRYDIGLTAAWAGYSTLIDVPIPAGATPDPGGDGHLSIIDVPGGFVYDLWQARRGPGGTWVASWGNRLPLRSDGIYPFGRAARGSGLASLAGVIWPHELEQGYIDHALVASWKPIAAGATTPPATASDGTSDEPFAVLEGTRLQLDPDIDIRTLGLEPWQETIARAMQEYGVVIGDTGSRTLGLYSVHPSSFDREIDLPFGSLDGGYAWLGDLPMESFRILASVPLALDSFDRHVADESIYRR